MKEQEVLQPDGAGEEEKILGDLIITNGEKEKIPAGSIVVYRNLTIESGGALVIEGPTKDWTEIYVLENLTIHGVIKVTDFKTPREQLESYERVAYDGRILEFTYKNNNNGGYGGDGGGHNIPNTALPGIGAKGSFLFGGGGGGGTGWRSSPPGQRGGTPQPGGNARESLGGNGGVGNGLGGSGGNGVRRSDTGDGGLLYISVGNTVDGKNGTIKIFGTDGLSAFSGANGDAYRGGNGGGGGGGAPGNHGGCIVLSAKITAIIELPAVIAHGGDGGSSGTGGSGWHQAGKAGAPGENGNNGKFLVMKYIEPE